MQDQYIMTRTKEDIERFKRHQARIAGNIRTYGRKPTKQQARRSYGKKPSIWEDVLLVSALLFVGILWGFTAAGY